MKNMRDYQKTHQKLLNSGLKLFLALNFETTSVRQICKSADVTTGAFYKHFETKDALIDELVAPYLVGLKNIYNQRVAHFQAFVHTVDVQAAAVTNVDFVKVYWEKNSDELEPIVAYMYEHADITKLILFKSDGSKYENILEQITHFSEMRVTKTLNWLQAKHLIKRDMRDQGENIHLYIYAYLATVFDILMHEYTLEKTKRLIHEVYLFMMPSWITYLLTSDVDI